VGGKEEEDKEEEEEEEEVGGGGGGKVFCLPSVNYTTYYTLNSDSKIQWFLT
jgi:hypothetical protein